MSKKNTKFEINLPKYDLQSQLRYITAICQEFDFDGDTLISYVMSDFIRLYDDGLVRGMSPSDVFVSYLRHIEKQHKHFLERKDEYAKK